MTKIVSDIQLNVVKDCVDQKQSNNLCKHFFQVLPFLYSGCLSGPSLLSQEVAASAKTFMFAEINYPYEKLTKVYRATKIRTNTELFELWLVLQDSSHGADVQVSPVDSEVGEVGERLWGELREAGQGIFCPF